MKPTRRLAAIMFTDMVGFSALTYRDELLSKELVAEQRKLIRQYISNHNGVENDTTGDGFLIEFSSAVDAVQCAVDIQTNLFERSKHLGLDRKIQIRIGIHVGDILVDGKQFLGNGVNIAARIEPLATPGGICMSRQVYDQVSEKLPDVQFKKIGHRKLKNISSGAELYHVLMPWQENENKKSRTPNDFKFKNLNSKMVPLAALFACSLFLLVMTLFRVQNFTKQFTYDDTRLPANAEAIQKIDLSNGWSYLLDNAQSPLEVRQFPDAGANWQAFESDSYEKYANIIHGTYWLRKEFDSKGDFRNPAFVLGLIPDKHRAFLNQKFVGGSDHLSDVAMYTFDASYILTSQKNIILIHAESRPTLKPGLTVLTKVGAFMSEFSVVREAVIKNQILFHLLRNMYFMLSLVIFASCLVLAIFQRENKGYFYSVFYLLLGAIHLIYYTPWVSEAFEFETVRFLKLFSIVMSSFILYSGFLQLHKKARAELINNSIAVWVAIGLTILFLVLKHTPEDFLRLYNQALLVCFAYSFVWPLVSYVKLPKGLRNPINFFSHTSGVYLAFGFLGTVSALSSLVNNMVAENLNDTLKDMSVMLPFGFSIFAVFTGTWEHILKNRIAVKEKRREELILELFRIVRSSADPLEAIQIFQKKTSDFIRATKSRIYIFEDRNVHEQLKLVFAIDKSHASLQFTQNIDSNEGAVGYVIKNRTPLLISDIRTDARFRSNQGERSSYRTGSCILIPLQANSQIMGVLTFADKRNDDSFNDADFKTALELSAVLGLLIANNQMKELITSQSIAS